MQATPGVACMALRAGQSLMQIATSMPQPCITMIATFACQIEDFL